MASEDIAQAYEQRSGHWQKGRGERLIELSSARPGERVLDIGCGTGALTHRLAAIVGPEGRVVGIDPDEERIRFARTTHAAPNLEFCVGAIEDLGAGRWDQPFDLVFSNYVLQWVRDKADAFRRMKGMIHPRGQIVVQAVAESPRILNDLSALMGSLAELMGELYFGGAEAYARALGEADLEVVHLEELTGGHRHVSLESLLAWWQATTNNRFDPARVTREALARFAEDHGRDGTFEVPERFVWFEARIR